MLEGGVWLACMFLITLTKYAAAPRGMTAPLFAWDSLGAVCSWSSWDAVVPGAWERSQEMGDGLSPEEFSVLLAGDIQQTWGGGPGYLLVHGTAREMLYAQPPATRSWGREGRDSSSRTGDGAVRMYYPGLIPGWRSCAVVLSRQP